MSLQGSRKSLEQQQFQQQNDEGFNQEQPFPNSFSQPGSALGGKNSQASIRQSKEGGGSLHDAYQQLTNEKDANFNDINSRRQIEEDNSEMGAIKRKLAQISQKPQPREKQAMVAWLQERLQIAESALYSMEEIIGRERATRKEMGFDLVGKNNTLRDMILSEKESLKEKVNTEMQGTLDHAQRDYQSLQDLNERTIQDLGDRRARLIQARAELNDLKNQAKQDWFDFENSKNDVDNMNKDIQQIKEEQLRLEEENVEREKAVQQAVYDDQITRDAFAKVDECRIVLNSLMGPGAHAAPQERHKFQQGAPSTFSGVTLGAIPEKNQLAIMERPNPNQINAQNNQSYKSVALSAQQQVEARQEEEFWFQSPSGPGASQNNF